MKYWDEHITLRIVIISVLFILGVAGIFGGLALKGLLSGVLLMIIGLAFLLAALWFYNMPYTDKK